VRRYADGKEQALPFQVLSSETNGEIMFLMDRLDAYQSKTVFIYANPDQSPASHSPAIQFKRTATGFTLDNGILKVLKNNMNNGNAFDRMELSGNWDGSCR
jgi:hypothetical protein